MFRRFDEDLPPPPWQPPRPSRPALTERQVRQLAWLIGANLLLLLFAPLAGVSLIEGLLALFR